MLNVKFQKHCDDLLLWWFLLLTWKKSGPNLAGQWLTFRGCSGACSNKMVSASATPSSQNVQLVEGNSDGEHNQPINDRASAVKQAFEFPVQPSSALAERVYYLERPSTSNRILLSTSRPASRHSTTSAKDFEHWLTLTVYHWTSFSCITSFVNKQLSIFHFIQVMISTQS